MWRVRPEPTPSSVSTSSCLVEPYSRVVEERKDVLMEARAISPRVIAEGLNIYANSNCMHKRRYEGSPETTTEYEIPYIIWQVSYPNNIRGWSINFIQNLDSQWKLFPWISLCHLRKNLKLFKVMHECLFISYIWCDLNISSRCLDWPLLVEVVRYMSSVLICVTTFNRQN